jgi:Fur family transcriptional regulator, ferric uptake regulator
MGKSDGDSAGVPDAAMAAKEKIRAAGLRGTPARVATLLALQDSSSPLTHAEVAERIESLGADKATVLRNLTDLVAAGLVRRTELGDHLWRYEAVDPAEPLRAHPHFLCIDCGMVMCLEDVELTASSRRRSERVGQITEVLLKGRCTDCQTAAI